MLTLIEHFKGSDLLNPIPTIKDMDGWRTLPICENGERLVPLGAFSDYPHIMSDAIYFGERSSSPYKHGELKDALITCFVREGVAKKLDQASRLLPDGYALMVFDSYRPLEVQNSLYVDYVQQLINVRGMSREEAEEAALTYVNRASDNPDNPSPHHTGGSVDLTIVKMDDDVVEEFISLNEKIAATRETIKQARAIGDMDAVDAAENIEYPLEMRKQELLRHHSTPIDVGANFDETRENSAVRYFEERIEAGENLTALEHEQAMNRRIFQNLLRSVGFSSFPHEWWHVDSGNQFNALQTGNAAVYGPIKLDALSMQHEEMRHGHYEGTNMLAHVIQERDGGSLVSAVNKLGQAASQPVDTNTALAQDGARYGDMRPTSHGLACRLEA